MGKLFLSQWECHRIELLAAVCVQHCIVNLSSKVNRSKINVSLSGYEFCLELLAVT